MVHGLPGGLRRLLQPDFEGVRNAQIGAVYMDLGSRQPCTGPG